MWVASLSHELLEAEAEMRNPIGSSTTTTMKH